MGIHVAVALLGLAACGDSLDRPPACDETLAGARLEKCLRTRLGVPPDAARVAVLGQSSHLDWDWLRTFEDYFRLSVDQIFGDALERRTRERSFSAMKSRCSTQSAHPSP
ncbi:MAG: hypothetical protein ACKPBU_15235, partial [Alphaproteobacteria bacterium]